MKPKTAFALLVILVAAVAFVAVRNSGLLKTAPKDAPAPLSKPLFPNASYDVNAVTIVSADGSRLALTRQGDEWQVAEPFAAKAAMNKIWRILTAMKEARYETVYEPNALDPKITRLDPPLWTVEMSDPNGGKFFLRVGARPPLDRKNTYVRPAGDNKTYVASEDFAELLALPASEYRDKTLLHVAAANVVRLQASGEELPRSYDMEKHGEDWGVTSPYTAPADKTVVRDLLAKFANVSASDIVAENPTNLAAYGLEAGKERLVLQLSIEEPKPQAPATNPATEPATTSTPAVKVTTLAFGEKSKDKVYVRLGDQKPVYYAEAALLDDVLKKLDALREKKLLDLDVNAVSAIDLKMPDGQASLAKEQGVWRMTQPQPGPTNMASILTMLNTIASLRAQDWADDKSIPAGVMGLASPYGQITLHLTGKAETVGILIGSTTGQGETYVKTAAGTAVAKVKNTEVQPLLASPATYWDPSLFALPLGAQVTQLVIQRRDDTFTLARGDDGRWLVTAPRIGPADQPEANRIANALSRVQATKVVAVATDVADKYAKAVHTLTVDIYTRSPAGTQPATEPASQASSAPSTQAASVPVSMPASEPASMPTSTSAPADNGVKVASLKVSKVDGKSYAWLIGPAIIAVGELPAAFYDDLAAELRDRTLWTFDVDDVKSFRIVAGDEKIEIRRETNDWTCLGAPDEKIDRQKVQAYLTALRALTVERYISDPYNPADAETLGLKNPWMTLEIRLGKDKPLTLTVSQRGMERMENRYAISGSTSSLFTLPADAAAKIAKTLKDFKPSAEAPTGGGNPMMMPPE